MKFMYSKYQETIHYSIRYINNQKHLKNSILNSFKWLQISPLKSICTTIWNGAVFPSFVWISGIAPWRRFSICVPAIVFWEIVKAVGMWWIRTPHLASSPRCCYISFPDILPPGVGSLTICFFCRIYADICKTIFKSTQLTITLRICSHLQYCLNHLFSYICIVLYFTLIPL